jgi:hypothetical protein
VGDLDEFTQVIGRGLEGIVPNQQQYEVGKEGEQQQKH